MASGLQLWSGTDLRKAGRCRRRADTLPLSFSMGPSCPSLVTAKASEAGCLATMSLLTFQVLSPQRRCPGHCPWTCKLCSSLGGTGTHSEGPGTYSLTPSMFWRRYTQVKTHHLTSIILIKTLRQHGAPRTESFQTGQERKSRRSACSCRSPKRVMGRTHHPQPGPVTSEGELVTVGHDSRSAGSHFFSLLLCKVSMRSGKQFRANVMTPHQLRAANPLQQALTPTSEDRPHGAAETQSSSKLKAPSPQTGRALKAQYKLLFGGGTRD